MSVYFLLYLILCLIAAILGRRTRIGFAGTLVLSILITPFWAFVGILCFSRPVVEEQIDTKQIDTKQAGGQQIETKQIDVKRTRID